MKRLLQEPAGYLAGLARSAVEGWSRFFFRPADPTPLGVIRLGVGLLLLWNFAMIGVDLFAMLGPDGWADPEAIRFFWNGEDSAAWSFWMRLPDAALVPAYILCLAVIAAFTVGLGSRWTAVLAWVIVVSTVRRAPVFVFGFDNIVSTLTLYLAVTGASGQAVSIDRYIKRRRAIREELASRRRADRPLEGAVPSGAPRPTVLANLGLRLIQLHLCLIYGLSGLSKLQSPVWWRGDALLSLLGYAEFRPVDLTFLAQWPVLLAVFTHLALFLEIAYPVLIWPKRLRPLMIAGVVGLHVGIMMVMGLYEFGLAMILANLAFASGPWLRSLVTGREPERLRVLFDGACPRCRASVALIGAGDPDRTVEWIDLNAVEVTRIHPSLTPEACLKAMQAVGPNDRLRSGYDAVLAVARRAPLFWPLAVVGALPGVTALGRRVYNGFAARRAREPRCTDETCALPGPLASAADRREEVNR